jgi:tetratricopeptide (TPR) repeat protein
LAEPKSIEAPIAVKQQLVEMLNVAGNDARESRWEASASVLHKVIETAKPYPGTEFELRQAYFNLASNEKQQGHTKEAEDALEQAISAVSEKAGQDSLESAMTLDQAASIEEQMNNDSRAESHLRRAINIREHKQTTADRQLVSEYTTLAELCLRHNRGKEAIALLQTIISKSGIGDSSDMALVWPIDVLGRTYQKQGNYPEAEKQFLRALHIMEERVPKNSVALQTPLSRLVPLYVEMGRIEDSEKIRQRMNTLLTRGAD